MIKLLDFQLRAIEELNKNMLNDNKEMVLKSPTGSGKTIILTHFMDQYGKGNFNNIFVWLTPGKGNLTEQSKEKMDRYIHNSSTKLLNDIITSGFRENDACFINWEKLTRKTNTAFKESEKVNFQERIVNAQNKGFEFIIIIDESHHNDTVKADDIINLFQPKKIIRTSATPTAYENADLIEVPEVDVIAEGLIKKMLIINEDFGSSIEVENQVDYLLDKAIDKQSELKKALNDRESIVNPMIVIQLPDNSEVLQDEVERYLATKDITYENGLLSVWLNEKKENLEEIEEMDAKPIVILMKQAVATGWDCPRCQILVKLREGSSETFEIQTIGRIRRMPEVKHYGDDLLDSCYLYTYDENFTEGVKLHLGKGALDAVKLYLKKEHRDIRLISQYKTDVVVSKDATQALKTMVIYYQQQYDLTTKTTENKIRLDTGDYVFSDKIVKKTRTGEVRTLNIQEFDDLSKVKMIEPLNTHKHGREYHNRVGALGLRIGLPYEQMNTIIRRLFDKNVNYNNKILRLDTRNVYSFVINNYDKLKEDFRLAMSSTSIQKELDIKDITESEFRIPKEFLFTYDAKNKFQKEYESNVYKGYLSSAEKRSDSEKTFESFCNDSDSVEWIYTNGDKGNDYLSIVYEDNFGKQKSFYPDYLIGVGNQVWIIETKGGFSRSGDSEDIDRFSAKKFNVLKKYLDEQNLKGGFVRKDKSNNQLFICMENYNDDINSDSWILLKEILP